MSRLTRWRGHRAACSLVRAVAPSPRQRWCCEQTPATPTAAVGLVGAPRGRCTAPARGRPRAGPPSRSRSRWGRHSLLLLLSAAPHAGRNASITSGETDFFWQFRSRTLHWPIDPDHLVPRPRQRGPPAPIVMVRHACIQTSLCRKCINVTTSLMIPQSYRRPPPPRARAASRRACTSKADRLSHPASHRQLLVPRSSSGTDGPLPATMGQADGGVRPAVGCGLARRLAQQLFGLRVVECRELVSYDDRNFYLKTGGRRAAHNGCT